MPTRSVSPIAQMQRRLYPPGSHPLGALSELGQCMQRSAVLPRASRTFQGFGRFGLLTTTGASTGISTGLTASSISTSIGTGLASLGGYAAAGSFVPIIGTAIGVIVGLIASGVFNHRVDPEVGNFNNAIALFNSQGPNAILNIADKYLVLAGLFDLEPGQIKGNIPIVKKYGRMGEQAFTTDMMNLVYQAAQTGAIGPNDTPASVMSKVVQPWIDRFGYGPMQDANADMINAILVGMIAEYVTGLWKNRWFARSGDMPHWQFPTFSLPGGAGVAPSTSGTPTQQATPVIAAPQVPQVPSAPPQGPSALPTDAQSVGTNNTGVPIFYSPSQHLYYTVGGSVYSGPLPTPGSAPVASVPTPTILPAVPQLSSVPIPPGFQLAGSANGLGAYLGPDGLYYNWNGSAMSPLTGTLTAPSGSVSVVNGSAAPSAVPLPSVPSLLQPSQQTQAPYYPLPSSPTIVNVPGQPTAAAPIAAGVTGAGLPSWAVPAAIGGVLLLLFATARPVGPMSYPRSGGRH